MAPAEMSRLSFWKRTLATGLGFFKAELTDCELLLCFAFRTLDRQALAKL